MHKSVQMSKRLRERNQKKPLPPKTIIDAFESAQEELNKGQDFLEKAIKEPRCILTESKEMLGTNRRFLFDAIARNKTQESTLTLHNIQTFLAHLANEYLQQWLKVQKMEEDIQIEVRNPLTYPSTFAVYYNDLEIVLFNIYEMWYGVRIEPQKEEAILMLYENEKRMILEEIEKMEEEFRIAMDMQKNPMRYSKKIADYIYIFFKRKKINTALQRKVKKQELLVRDSHKKSQEMDEYLPIRIDLNKQREKGLQIMTLFFEQLDYEIQTDKSRLY